MFKNPPYDLSKPYGGLVLAYKKDANAMLNIAVCDDESVEIEYLTQLTRQWASFGMHRRSTIKKRNKPVFKIKY